MFCKKTSLAISDFFTKNTKNLDILAFMWYHTKEESRKTFLLYFNGGKFYVFK